MNMTNRENQPLTSIEWTDELEIALLEAMHVDGHLLFPSEVNEFLNRARIHHQFEAMTGLRVEWNLLWSWIDEQFDMQNLENFFGSQFPNQITNSSHSDDEIFQNIMMMAENEAIDNTDDDDDTSLEQSSSDSDSGIGSLDGSLSSSLSHYDGPEDEDKAETNQGVVYQEPFANTSSFKIVHDWKDEVTQSPCGYPQAHQYKLWQPWI